MCIRDRSNGIDAPVDQTGDAAGLPRYPATGYAEGVPDRLVYAFDDPRNAYGSLRRQLGQALSLIHI